MKLAMSSYCFDQLIEDGLMPQIDCIAKAKELGFDAVEIVGIMPHDGSDRKEYAKKLRAELDRLNLPISNYTASGDLLAGFDGDLEKQVADLKEHVDIAQILGVKSMRHNGTFGYPAGTRGFNGFDQALPRLVKGCLEITKYAQTKGVRTMVENHGIFCQDSDRVEKLVNAVAHENFGLLVDMGNFLCADENPLTAVGRVAHYAFYVHAKDMYIRDGSQGHPGGDFFQTRAGNYLRGAIIGHGDIPVKQCLSAVKAAGYDGYIGLEFEGMEDTMTALEICQKNLRKYIAEM